jgi:hypothetical protein
MDGDADVIQEIVDDADIEGECGSGIRGDDEKPAHKL